MCRIITAVWIFTVWHNRSAQRESSYRKLLTLFPRHLRVRLKHEVFADLTEARAAGGSRRPGKEFPAGTDRCDFFPAASFFRLCIPAGALKAWR